VDIFDATLFEREMAGEEGAVLDTPMEAKLLRAREGIVMM
jgi:hypothetical protein